MAAIRLSHHNRALAADMQAERQRTETANLELRVAQQELSEINRSLESRIQARTVQLAQEIVEKERFAKDLAYLASTDPLTGIPNRLTIGKHLAEAMNHARSAGQPLAVLFIDLDKFKEVNDVMGHWAGDRVLHTVARRLSECVLPTAELARWGGDEFVVILPGPLTTNDVMEFANTLRNRLCNHIEIDPGIVTIDATVGIALFPEHGETQEELIRAADMAMYDGKERRAKIQLFDASLSQRLTERHLFERALRSAVGSPAFSLVFQPIYGSRSGRCEIVEALTRWQHPRRGAIPPSKFIPVAERTGEINAIGRWVLREACRTAASWRGDNPPAVSVNISAVQIQSGSLVPDVLFALEESSLPPNRLHLELTESVFAGDHNVINPVLQYLRSKGLSILLDDFGTGFSCLSYLRHLPIDMIKIDKSFVESVCVDSGPIIQTIITTAQTFGLKTVAEGVETSQQASRIRELHANYLQGFLFSPALPADKLDL
jgi:diguanylate cyclase (GGDEF)-like protein